MSGALPGSFTAFHGARSLFHFIEQAQVLFHFLIEPVTDHLMAHRHTHFHHTGDITQKFVIHSIFLCKALDVIIAAQGKKKSVTREGMKIKNPPRLRWVLQAR